MKVAKQLQARYPLCDFCQKSLRKPCTLAYEDVNTGEPRSHTVCTECYRIAFALQRFRRHGYIEVKEHETQ